LENSEKLSRIDKVAELPKLASKVETLRTPNSPIFHQEAQQKAKEPAATTGETVFNYSTYLAVGYLANFAVSVYTAYAADHGWLAPRAARGARWTGNNFFRQSGEELENAGKLEKIGNSIKETFNNIIGKGKGEFSEGEMHRAEEVFNYFRTNEKYKEAFKNGKGEFIHSIVEAKPEIIAELNTHLKNSSNENLKNLAELTSDNYKDMHRALTSFNRGNGFISFTALNVGGWAVLAPMLGLEKNKQKLVEKYDNHFIDGKTDQQKQEIEARHEYLKCQPEQTLGTMLSSRVVSTGAIYATLFAVGTHNNWFTKITKIKFNGISDFLEKKATEFTQIISKNENTKAGFNKVGDILLKKEIADGVAGEKLADLKKSRMESLATYIFTDSVYAGIMACYVFLGTRLLAPFMGSKKEEFAADCEQGNMPNNADSVTPHKPNNFAPASQPEKPNSNISQPAYDNRLKLVDFNGLAPAAH